MAKACSKCGEIKALSDFYKHGNRLRSQCKSCVDARNKDRYYNVLSKDPAFKQRQRERGLRWYYENRERSNKRIAANHRAERLTCIQHYGGACACCGESIYEFLSIDHANGGGTKHRKSGISKICRWLIKNKFPPEFRVLCHNCNQAIGFHGTCPHQTTKIL